MTKEMYDYINKELNSHNFYDIKEIPDYPNVVFLVWKGTDKVFATLERDKIKRAMENDLD